MKRILSCVLVLLIPFASMADQHGKPDADVRQAVDAFNGAYASNEVEAYFTFYVPDATLYFYGARLV